LEQAASELRSQFGEDAVHAVAADLAQVADAVRAARAAHERFGAPDCVVLNAGSGRGPRGWDVGREAWQAAIDMNLWPAIHLTEAALPQMVERGSGTLVFIASIVGLEVTGAPVSYTSAKAATVAYAAGLARDLGPRGIRSNSVAPGNVIFDGSGWAEKVEEDPEGWRDYVEREVPVRRFGTPEEIAAAVVFLASDRAGFITGECLVVDGGQTRRIA
jgi:3-oxoacyl-[acyl-carrier protein] reductase